MTSFDKVEQAVREANLTVGQHNATHLMCICPVHEDRNPSLSIDYRSERVLMKCHGCEADVRDIVAALNLTMEDLFDEGLEPDTNRNNVPVAEYRYRNPYTGDVEFIKRRYHPKTFRVFHVDDRGNEHPGLGGKRPWLYNSEDLKTAIPAGDPIFIVEGESDCESVKAMGGTATTQPMGAGTGKWHYWMSSQLTNAKEVRIIVDLDSDKDDGSNTGRDYAFEVYESLTAVGVKASLWQAKEGKDASDHRKAGYGLEDFVRYQMPRQRVEGTTGNELVLKEFPPLIFAVEDILCQGVAMLVSAAKAGKSWLALDMAIGVASGGMCLGGLRTTEGDVLYLGFEDSERRMKSRIDLLTEGNYPDLSRIEFQTLDTGWVGGDRGLSWMEEWALEVEEPRLIIVDTYGKAEPNMGGTGNSYTEEQNTMKRYAEFARRHDCTVLLIHHDRKSNESEDWLDKISGTKAVSGGLDTILYMDVKRGEREGSLRVDGRDVEADAYPIVKVPGRPFWSIKRMPSHIPHELSAEEIRLRNEAAQAVESGLDGSVVRDGAEDRSRGDSGPVPGS